MLQQKLICLRQPQVGATQWIIIEGSDAQHAQRRVINVQHLHTHTHTQNENRLKLASQTGGSCSWRTHRLWAHKNARVAQLSIGSSVRKGGRKNLASLDVNAHTIDDGAIDLAAQHCVQLAHASLRQIDFEVMLVEWFCKGLKLVSKNLELAKREKPMTYA